VHQREPGDFVEIELLRGPEWMAEHHPAIGGWVWLDLPEMGVVGLAEVKSIGACLFILEVPPGYGVVTALFRHTAGEVWSLRLVNSDEAILGTGSHPFWSLDRQDWVSLCDLRKGERLSGLSEPVQVESITLVAESQPVYNMEVHGDHCYRVGQQGLLVHNASAKEEHAKAVRDVIANNNCSILQTRTIKLTEANWANPPFPGDKIVYLVYDKNGTLLKAGSTGTIRRFEVYHKAMTWCKEEVPAWGELTVYAWVVCGDKCVAKESDLEAQVRTRVCPGTGKNAPCPWDNSGGGAGRPGRLDRSGPGTPYQYSTEKVDGTYVRTGEWHNCTDYEHGAESKPRKPTKEEFLALEKMYRESGQYSNRTDLNQAMADYYDVKIRSIQLWWKDFGQ
jgi:hypothetical protein